MNKSYSELLTIPTYEDRVRYLHLGQHHFEENDEFRYFKQMFYRTYEWRKIRRDIVLRDKGCDLALPELFSNGEKIYIHHINPIGIDDIRDHSKLLVDPENLITTFYGTHDTIHYGNLDSLFNQYVERKPNDTCPWK